MNNTKSFICALLISCLAVPVYAAPTFSGAKTKELTEVQTKIDAKNYQAAIDELKSIIEKEPKNADALNLLGYSNRKLKHYDIAEDYYQQALKLEPEHKGALEYLGELYVETNRMDDAQKMLTRLDDACFFSCKEYSQLKTMIERKQQGLATTTNW